MAIYNQLASYNNEAIGLTAV